MFYISICEKKLAKQQNAGETSGFRNSKNINLPEE